MKNNYLFTSESVSEGHPDKICDRISDAVVDLMLSKYPEARVACETLVTTNRTIVAGEYYYMKATRDDDITLNVNFGDAKFHGGSLFAHYFVTGGANVKISDKKGKIGGVKCKAKFGCTALKVMYEKIDATHSEATIAKSTAGHIAHFGINHYFNKSFCLRASAEIIATLIATLSDLVFLLIGTLTLFFIVF